MRLVTLAKQGHTCPGLEVDAQIIDIEACAPVIPGAALVSTWVRTRGRACRAECAR